MDILGKHSLSISWTGNLKSSSGSYGHEHKRLSIKLIMVMINLGLDQVRRTNFHKETKIGVLYCMDTGVVRCFEHPLISRQSFTLICLTRKLQNMFPISQIKESFLFNYVFELLIHLAEYVFSAYYNGFSTVPHLFPGPAPWWGRLPRSSGWCSPAGWVSRHGSWSWRCLVRAPRSAPRVPGQT